MKDAPLLQVKDLYVQYMTDEDVVYAVNGLSAELYKGESLGFVGETGAGKTTTALSIIQLLPEPAGVVTGGEIWFEGKNLLENKEKDNVAIRGDGISMIFQDVMTSLNPLMTIGRQIMEPMMVHIGMSKKAARARAIELLDAVGIPMPEKRVDEYPNSLSGGMRQRVMIAIALACTPKVLIADEPTTALDVTIQAQILELMKKIRKKYGTSIIMISHDLGVIAEMCDRAAVMYCGNIAEEGSIEKIFDNPMHPYTKGLLKSIPTLEIEDEELYSIPGIVPSLHEFPKGCKFAERCFDTCEKCRTAVPSHVLVEEEHYVSCVKFGGNV